MYASKYERHCTSCLWLCVAHTPEGERRELWLHLFVGVGQDVRESKIHALLSMGPDSRFNNVAIECTSIGDPMLAIAMTRAITAGYVHQDLVATWKGLKP